MEPPAIPVEILNAIFDFLSDSTSDLKTCSLVSPAWHAAAAKILFSELHLLCSLDHPNPPALPQSKRRFDLAYGIFPVYRKKWLMEDTDAHCICSDNQDRTIQSFCSNGISSMVNITSNVARLKLMFCRSGDGPLEPVSNGPHSLQLYPDSTISTLLQLIDELSFVHLRFLTIDSAPQVLYFMICEPFSGVLSSAPSLEEIKFTSFESMQNSDIKRLLNKHTFSCTRFPRLRRIVFQGLFGTNTSGPYGPRMSCALELTRTDSIILHDASASSVSVGVSYSSYQDSLTEPDGFSRFEIPGWCCFSGLCKNLPESKSLVDVMSLGSGFKDWSLPTIGIILGAFQSDTLGLFARTLDVKVSSDVNDPSGTKLFAYITQTYPRISSLNLFFSSIVEMRLALLHNTEQGSDHPLPGRITIIQQLLLLSELSSLKLTLYDNAAFMTVLAFHIVHSQNQSLTVMSDLRPDTHIIQHQLEIISAMDSWFLDLALLSISRSRSLYGPLSSSLQEVVLVIDMHDTNSVWDLYHRTHSSDFDFQAAPTLDPRFIERELEIMFPRVRAASPNFLTVQIL
ncbi:hypothetical protein EV359DRAFT_85313 [Lentinula novae-zelandiae]|nr:hypothetical protein EV359DRAFT_85313 [Lentinula novae-zelandiae]